MCVSLYEEYMRTRQPPVTLCSFELQNVRSLVRMRLDYSNFKGAVVTVHQPALHLPFCVKPCACKAHAQAFFLCHTHLLAMLAKRGERLIRNLGAQQRFHGGLGAQKLPVARLWREVVDVAPKVVDGQQLCSLQVGCVCRQSSSMMRKVVVSFQPSCAQHRMHTT